MTTQFATEPLVVGDTPMPAYPTFENVDEERLHRKQRLAAAFRVFGKLGFDEGVAGHITARDPELTDHFWVNPLGVAFSQIKVSDLELVSHDGRIVVGDRPINRAAFVIHSQVHIARPDVIAAAHSHALYGKAWSSLGRLLDPITQDACIFYGAHSLYDDFNGVVLDEEEGRNVGAALGPVNKAVILQNHGFLTVGRSVDEAAFLFITAEHSAHAQLLAEAAGTPKLIRHDVAAPLGADRNFAWYSFKPYWDQITAEQPDLFD
jgi:ribulose-5-phosphate 4-epimerase/fuculose-1-phosphate aldolase